MRTGYALTVVSLLVLCGCTHSEEYPTNWPKLVSGGCVALSGTYANIGVGGESNENSYPRELATRFFDLEGAGSGQADVLKKIDRVVLTYDPVGILSVDARQGATSLLVVRFSEKDKTLKCTREGAVLARYSGWARGAGNPLVGREHNSDVLISAVDGSLIIRYTGGGTGLAYGVYPVSFSQTSWLRWQRIDAPPKSP